MQKSIFRIVNTNNIFGILVLYFISICVCLVNYHNYYDNVALHVVCSIELNYYERILFPSF